jgi:hypothetical protein
VLPHGAFMALLLAVARVLCCYLDHVLHVGRVLGAVLGAARVAPG